jgi:hypothetical protein
MENNIKFELTKNNNMVYYILFMKIGIFLLFLANSVLLYSQNILEINKLGTHDLIAGPRIGYGSTEPEQWKLYKIIAEKYSSELIETEYFRTESITSKIYLYWILRERGWQNLTIIYEDLMKYREYKLWFSPIQCIIYSEPIEVEHIINYNEIQENTDDYSEDFDYFELFDKPNEIYERLFEEMLSEYLKLPYLDIENIKTYE